MAIDVCEAEFADFDSVLTVDGAALVLDTVKGGMRFDGEEVEVDGRPQLTCTPSGSFMLVGGECGLRLDFGEREAVDAYYPVDRALLP